MSATKLTTADLSRAFDVSTMSVYLWRFGTATKEALPCNVDDKGRVTFALGATKAWAKKHGLSFDLSRPARTGAGKGGPKHRVAPQLARVGKAEAALMSVRSRPAKV